MKNICFVTSEIWPGTKGGIGRLISETCKEISGNNIAPVILLEKVNASAVQEFRDFAGEHLPGAKVYSVDELLANRSDIIPEWAFHYSYYHRSYKIALALEALLETEKIDGIEFPDYLGPGYVFIKRRKLWRKPELSMPVWIRLHGTAELVDRADDREQFSMRTLQMYDMERYCLEHADFLVAPSEAMAEWYLKEYKIKKPYFHQAPGFQKITGGNIHPRNQDFDKPRILFYGKLQHVKGPDLLVKAGVAFLEQVNSRAEFIIIGQNMPFSRKYASSKEELIHLIPEKYRDHFTFINGIKPEQLPDYAMKCQVAVVPSRLETYCLAAHELNWLGIPLILNDIPAFEDFFTHGTDCMKFSRTPIDLFEVLKDFFIKGKAGQNLKWNSATIETSQVDLYKNLLSQTGAIKKADSQAAPLVSVVIPYFNMQDYIDQTLESVLNQTYTHWEIVLVNDGSTQEEAVNKLDLLKQNYQNNPKVKILDKENGGLGSARNFGIKHSNGKYILPLDSDDMLHPRFLELGVAALENNPDLAAVSCYVNFFQDGDDPTSIIDYVIPYDLNPVLITRENRAGVATSLFRKEVFETTAYDEALFSYEDWDLWWSLAEKGLKAEVMPEILFHYRRRAASMVNTVGRHNHAYLMTKLGERHPRLIAGTSLQDYCYFVSLTSDYEETINSRAFKLASFWGKALRRLKTIF